jgi:type III restriction enzyme
LITLYKFQQDASDKIAQRVVEFVLRPVTRGRGDAVHRVPFVQFLNSITASGKTVILADAVAQIAADCPAPPVVLWLSQLTVVVEQSFANLDVGGTYHDLIDDFEVRALIDLKVDELTEIDRPFLYFATTGKFNQKDKEGRKVFASRLDIAAESIWDSLALRPAPNGLRRPLIVVYDEAHNLSAQQTKLLLDREPDAFILATATTRISEEFRDGVLQPLRTIGEVEDELLNTVVVPSEVATTGLVKDRVDLIGRLSSMEDVVSEVVGELGKIEADGEKVGLAGRPKAVYVCRTNITEGDDRQRDDPRRPFALRQAPPILIWRHLVEGLGVDPKDIAVYCDLKVDPNHALPEEFILFSGRDKDYETFAKGDYQHIIFNQSLQEGWDDPLVYCAYIDRTLGSTIKAEQIVGRLLRQPGRKHYPSERLNTAQVHVRVQSNTVFQEVVDSIKARLQDDQAPVTVTATKAGAKPRKPIPPKGTWIVPDVATHTEDAIEVMEELLSKVPLFKPDDTNTVGVGRRAVVQRVLGDSDAPEFAWEEVGTSARIVARWMFSRELRRFHRDAAAAITLDEPKWDVRIGVGSQAATTLAMFAEDVGRAFLEHSYVEVADCNDDDYTVLETFVSVGKVEKFTNAIHAGYTGLNTSLELPFAKELDKTGLTWCRNPSRSGYGIPTIKQGSNDTFYPDFLAWKGKSAIFAIDTKNATLHEDARRKLVRIRQAAGRPKIHIRFVLMGTFDSNGVETSKAGFTVMGFGPDGDIKYTNAADMKKAVGWAIK